MDESGGQHSLLAMYDGRFMVCFAGIHVCVFQNTERLDGAGIDYRR